MLPAKLTVLALLATVWCCTSQPDILYSVACPSTNNILQCPERHVITVGEVRYGKANAVDCAASTQAATVFSPDQTCIHPSLITWVQFICDGQERCRLPKPDTTMFVCDTNDNFVQVDYTCRNQRPGKRSLVACEGQTAQLSCDAGSSIEIIRARYGRFDEQLCSDTPSVMTFCSSYSTQGTVSTKCNGQNTCQVTADSTLGPAYDCDDLPKYLTVNYVCV
ncbi:L-rhamnose-binding lectin CSL3-like [Nerophis lumbriciformis]|uniref:L-rhamnose-binding lectin CSL3-like n=1 Tax=Nerophis lumbriciformis TaxID=546530 RepID=UPI002AE0672D|nr:L-rhamnose-binding lectin CSL3-like [Nerophis lumbriciformis]